MRGLQSKAAQYIRVEAQTTPVHRQQGLKKLDLVPSHTCLWIRPTNEESKRHPPFLPLNSKAQGNPFAKNNFFRASEQRG